MLLLRLYSVIIAQKIKLKMANMMRILLIRLPEASFMKNSMKGVSFMRLMSLSP